MAKKSSKAATPPKFPWQAFINWQSYALLWDEIPNIREPALQKKGWFVVLAGNVGADDFTPESSWHLVYIGEAMDHTLGEIPTKHPKREAILAAVPPGKQALVIVGVATNRSRKKRDPAYRAGVLRCLRQRHRCLVVEPEDHQPYTGEPVRVSNEGDRRPLQEYCLLRPDPNAPKQVQVAPPKKRMKRPSGRFNIAPAGSKSALPPAPKVVRRKRRRPAT